MREVPSKYYKKTLRRLMRGRSPHYRANWKMSRILLPLIFLCVIGLDGFGLDDDGGIAAGEGAAFGGDGAGDSA